MNTGLGNLEAETGPLRLSLLHALAAAPAAVAAFLVRAAQRLLPQPTLCGFDSAAQQLLHGRAQAMRDLANDGLGDAWLALARLHESDPSAQAQADATMAYGMAMVATKWRGRSDALHARKAYVGRCFSAQGVDFIEGCATLCRLSTQHIGVSNIEQPFLAWIRLFGPQHLRDLNAALEHLHLCRCFLGHDGMHEVAVAGRTLHQMDVHACTLATPRQLAEARSQARRAFERVAQ